MSSPATFERHEATHAGPPPAQAERCRRYLKPPGSSIRTLDHEHDQVDVNDPKKADEKFHYAKKKKKKKKKKKNPKNMFYKIKKKY